MVAATTTPADFNMGRVFERAFGVLGRNFVPFFVLALLTALPNFLLTMFLVPRAEAVRVGSASPFTYLATLFGGIAVSMVLGVVLQGALAHGTYADLNGRRASFFDCLRTGIREILPLAGIGVFSALGVIGGMLLLIVPGVMLALAWSVAAPVRVVEHTAVVDSLSRSAVLTRGHRWPIFGIYAVVTIASGVLSAVISSILGGAVAAGVPVIAASGLLGALTAAVMGTIVASIYYELRSLKEGIGPEQLAAVFD